MHTLHVKKSHSDCSQSLIKIHPNRLLCCLLLLHHVFVRFVYYFMQSKTPRSISLHSNSPFPVSRKSAVICRRSARHYHNKPYIAKKRILSAVRSYLNLLWCKRLKSYGNIAWFNVSATTQPVLNRGQASRSSEKHGQASRD